MTVTAPELRRGGSPTVASDLYAVGALMLALLEGRLGDMGPDIPRSPEVDAARQLMAEDPEARAPLSEVLKVLRQPVADVRELETAVGDDPVRRARETVESDLDVGVRVEASDAWTDGLLDALCRLSSPWLQPSNRRPPWGWASLSD